MKTRYNNSRAFSRMLNWREMSGYQPRSLREEIGLLSAETRPRRELA